MSGAAPFKPSYYLNGPWSHHDAPWEPTIGLVAEAGFEGLLVSSTGGRYSRELGLFRRADRARMRRLAAENGLAIAGIADHYFLTDAIQRREPLWLRDLVDVARDLGTDIVTIHMGDHAAPPWTEDEVWARAVAAFRDAADYGASDGVRVAIHAIGRAYLTDSPERVDRFLNEVDRPNVGWSYAPGHLASCGLDPVAAARHCRRWIVHVAVSDFLRGEPDVDWTCIVGDGLLELAPVFAILTEVGFDGFVSAGNCCRVELADPPAYPVELAIGRTMATYRAASVAAGLRAGAS